ncbi:MAG: glycosyltransferase family 2 protein [Pedosphaera sp.]|nr:glycosyltransferase family 2 protein [Pedosphaera sp.]
MSSPILSIHIPTRNRSGLLRDLLVSLEREIRTAGLGAETVCVEISDNASEDATSAIAEEFVRRLPHFTYFRNPTNVGASRNVIGCVRRCRAEYCWCIGDDEVLAEHALQVLLEMLANHKPAWYAHYPGYEYGKRLGLPAHFNNVDEFVRAAAEKSPDVLITAGTISLNTFRTGLFDIGLAESLADTSSYAHWFALMKGLQSKGGSIVFGDIHTVLVRAERPAPSDNELPPNSDANWRACLVWLKSEFHLPDLDPDIQSRLISRDWMRQVFQSPLKTFRNNYRLFLIPGTYPRIVRRLWYFIKP